MIDTFPAKSGEVLRYEYIKKLIKEKK